MEWIIVLVLICCIIAAVEEAAVEEQKRGQRGEEKVYDTLEKLDGHKAMIRNCYLPTQRGDTTEVDLVLIHESGIYVIESKNYSGWIFGSDSRREWTQTFPKGNGETTKYKFYNPILQNGTHIKEIQRILGEKRNNIYSYVVFGDDCELMNVQWNENECHVLKRRELLQNVKQNAVAHGRVLSNEAIDSYCQKLFSYTQVSKEQKQEHIHNIEEKYKPISRNAVNTDALICLGVAENWYYGRRETPQKLLENFTAAPIIPSADLLVILCDISRCNETQKAASQLTTVMPLLFV